MANPPSIASRHADGSSSDSIASTCIPIIFVPGVMGSRFDTGVPGRVWDPDSVRAMAPWGAQLGALGEQQATRSAFRATPTPAAPLPSFSSDASDAMITSSLYMQWINHFLPTANPPVSPETKAAFLKFYVARGWQGVAWAFYGNLLIHLETMIQPHHPFEGSSRFPVYAFGYDWRQSNTVSGTFLADFINEVLDATENNGATHVVLVTHSMGGLVVRGMLQARPESVPKVLGVAHCLQPSNGAAVCYRRFLSGQTGDLDNAAGAVAAWILDRILGPTAPAYAYNMSGAPGPLQLLPNHVYQAGYDGGGSWITGLDSSVDLSQIYQLYGQPTWPGILGAVTAGQTVLGTSTEQSGGTVVSDFNTNLNAAQIFHQNIATTYHSNTYVLYSSGLATDDSVAFTAAPVSENTSEGPPLGGSAGVGTGSAVAAVRGGAFVPKKMATGDGTVPGCSARCPGCTSPLEPPFVADTPLEHSAAFANENFNAKVIAYVQKLISLQASK